jgi:hypothetical protein
MDIWSSGSLPISVMTTTRCFSTYGSMGAASRVSGRVLREGYRPGGEREQGRDNGG